MKIYAFLLVILASSQALAGWQEEVRKLLPSELRNFKNGVTTQKEVEEKIGKAALIKGTKQYWVFEGFEYALELDFSNQKISSMHFTFPGKGPEIGKLGKMIKSRELKPSKEAPTRFLEYSDKTGALTLDMTSQRIHSVRFP